MHAEIRCGGTAIASGDGRNIFVISNGSAAGLCQMCGQEEAKNRCRCHVTLKYMLLQ